MGYSGREATGAKGRVGEGAACAQKVTIIAFTTSSVHNGNSIYTVFNTVKKFTGRKWPSIDEVRSLGRAWGASAGENIVKACRCPLDGLVSEMRLPLTWSTLTFQLAARHCPPQLLASKITPHQCLWWSWATGPFKYWFLCGLRTSNLKTFLFKASHPSILLR